jgi:MFS family permease
MNEIREIGESAGSLKIALRALRYRNFRLFLAGQGISVIGSWMQSTALSWLVYRMTGSTALFGLAACLSVLPAVLTPAFVGQGLGSLGPYIQMLAAAILVYGITGSKAVLGLVACLSAIPMILAPIAGVVSDRVSRRPVLIITQTLAMLQAFALSALALTGVIQIWHIVALGAFAGLVQSFDMPVRQAFVIEMIDRRADLGNAIALNSLIFNCGRFIGPALAGLMTKLYGEGTVFLVNGVSFLAVIVSYFMMRVPPLARSERNTRIFPELAEGVTYVFRNAPMRAVMLLVAGVSLVGLPYAVLVPVVAKDILKGGAGTYGWLMGGVGLGAIAGALYLASRREVSGFARQIQIASGLLGVGLVAFSQARSFTLSFLLLAVIGFSVILLLASSNTVIQTMVHDDKRGRIMGLYGLCFLGVAPVGSLLAGAVAEKMGAPLTLLIGGGCCVAGAVAFSRMVRAVREAISPLPPEKGVPAEIAGGIRAAGDGILTRILLKSFRRPRKP